MKSPVYEALCIAIDAAVGLTITERRPSFRKLCDELLERARYELGLVPPWARIKDTTGRALEVRVDAVTREPVTR